MAEEALRGTGDPLPWRGRLEKGFQRDLRSVRVHSGPEAESACARLGAEAFTMGNHIASRRRTPAWVLAHEVAHSLQAAGTVEAPLASRGDAEADASRAADTVASGRPASVHASTDPGVPHFFRLTDTTQKEYPKAAAFLRDEMPKIGNDARLLNAVVEGGRAKEDTVRAGLPWDKGPWVTPKMLRGERAGTFKTGQGSQELEVHKGELEKWKKETDPALNQAYEFWLETVVLHEYVHYLGDNRETSDEEWGADFEEKAYGNQIATRDAAWNLENFLRARFRDGEYEVKVVGKEAGFKQRFRVVGADAGDGTYDGVVGTTVKVSKGFDPKARWEIFVDHDDGTNGWQTSQIRKVFVSIGSEFLIRTEDWTDRDRNDLEISVKRTASAKPPPPKSP